MIITSHQFYLLFIYLFPSLIIRVTGNDYSSRSHSYHTNDLSSQRKLPQEHLLYDLNLPNNKVVNVSTIIQNVNRPIGIALGYYQNKKGIFMTSFATSDVRFIETTLSCELSGNCKSYHVAGTGFSGNDDGSLETSTFTDPSRLVYLEEQNVLFITDRATGHVRYIDFDTNLVGTLTQSDGRRISFLPYTRPDNQPGTDLKYYQNYLYLTDGINVYNVTGINSEISAIYSSAIITQYTSLRQWQILNDYDSSKRKIYITSIAVNSNRQVMYVSYTLSRSALVVVPLNSRSPTEISILYSDGILWDSDQLFTIGYPRPRNGNLFSSPVTGYSLVTYPMHMYHDPQTDTLYWTEVYAHLSSGTLLGALGAVALRRLNLLTNEIDYYAGDEGVFRPILGRTTGYKDGASNKAQFSYPMTIAFDESSNGLGPEIYIGDYGNNAIRKIATHVNTPSPTMAPTYSVRPTQQPTISLRPTLIPSIFPTLLPTRIPTSIPSVEPTTSQPTTATPSLIPSSAPTGIPTSVPSVTMAPTKSLPPTSVPTELNGDCIEIILFDEFGDGWNGLSLNVTFSPPPDSLSHDHPNPSRSFSFHPTLDISLQTHLVCASLDRPHELGTYTIQFASPSSFDITEIPFHWEIGFQISTKNMKYTNIIYGNIATRIELEFTSKGEFSYQSILYPKKLQDTCDRCPHPKPKPPLPSSSPSGNEVLPSPSRPTGIPLHLYEINRGIWFLKEQQLYQQPRYVISDTSALTILKTGQMCHNRPEKSEICEIILDDGDYFFRVGSQYEDSEISWNFCGTHGTSREELSFSIIGGHCHLGHHVTLEMMLSSTEETLLTLEGELMIENIFTPELSISDQRIIEMSLADSFSMDSSVVTLIDICQTQPGLPCYRKSSKKMHLFPFSQTASTASFPSDRHQEERSLSATFTFHVTFIITVTLEKQKLESVGTMGTQTKPIWTYVTELKERFQVSYQEGELQGLIRSHSSSLETSALGYIRLEKQRSPLTSSLNLMHVTYKYVPLTFSPSTSPVTSDTLTATVVVINETTQQEILVLTPFIFIFGAIGLVLFLASRSSRTASANPTTTLTESQDYDLKQMEEDIPSTRHPFPSSLDLNGGDDILVQQGLHKIPDDHDTKRFVIL